MATENKKNSRKVNEVDQTELDMLLNRKGAELRRASQLRSNWHASS